MSDVTLPNLADGLLWVAQQATDPASPLDLIKAAGVIAGALIAVLTLLGIIGRFAWKWFLEPWLREHLIEPVQETRHQVTENSHASPKPTVPDRIDDLRTDLLAEVRAVADRLDEHIAAADKRHSERNR